MFPSWFLLGDFHRLQADRQRASTRSCRTIRPASSLLIVLGVAGRPWLRNFGEKMLPDAGSSDQAWQNAPPSPLTVALARSRPMRLGNVRGIEV